MKKLIKINFDNTTRERKTEDSFSELYSYDKNNGSFEFEILNDTLTTEQVTALFKFTESNKIWKTTGTVEGNKVHVTFDTSLITQNETVICYLYFDEEQRTSDTFRFKFKVKVSEIDKMGRYEIKERFVNNTVIVDRLDVVTKDELKEALKNVGGVATEGLLTEVKAEELYAKKSEAVDNTNFELVKNRILALELKTDKDTIYNDSELRNRVEVLENKPPVDLSGYATKEELRTVSGSQPLADNLVTKEELENKHYISDVSNLATKEELQEVRNSQPTVDTSNLVTRDELTAKNYLTEHQPLDNLVTKQELEEKHYLTTHQDLSEYAKKSELYNDTPLKERVTALESKAIEGGAYDDSDLRSRVVALESKEDKDTKYDDTEVKRRLTELEGKPVLDTSFFITEEKLNSKGYLTQHQPLDNLVTKEELSTKGYVTEEVLNGKNYLTEDVLNTKNYLTQHQDLSSLVTKQELENKQYLTQHQPLTHLATTSDLEALRNIAVSKSELSKKVDTTEYNNFKDNVVTKTELAEKGYISDLSNYVTKEELPTPYNDSALVSRVTALESKTNTNQTLPANQYEIHGTGMPNGVVEAELGTTYVDKNKTNGALKWIKTTDGGNQGWEVLIGDTGWRTLNSVSRAGNSFIKIRRVNNLVTYQFGGLQWGWFGVNRRNGPDFVRHNSSGDKGAKVLRPGGIPVGFRSESSLIGGIYSDAGKPYGIWYLGGTSDSNFIQFTFNDPIPTDKDIGDIRVSAISYLTNEPWPTQLP